MSRPEVEAFFLPRDDHSLFCLLFSPSSGQSRVGAMLHVPAFAEEMNKSRRAVANAARRLAEQGWQVLVFDLHGTGDSTGDFSNATWAGWNKDVRAAYDWLQRHSQSVPVLWGLRVGCLLINDVLPQVPAKNVIYWQPFTAGDTALTQFLRLRTFSLAASAAGQKDTTRTLLDALQRGESLDIAGYELPPAIALPLRAARLEGAAHAGRNVSWLEVSLVEPPALSPNSRKCIDEIRSLDAKVASQAVPGAPFWMTQEIDEAAEFVSATTTMAGTIR